MSMAADCTWSAARGGLIACACVLAAAPLQLAVSGLRGPLKRLAWGLLLVPCFTPVLLVAYGYLDVFNALARHPGWRQAGYAALLWMRLVPVAVVAVQFAPRSLSAEALHCHRLLGPRRRGALGMLVHGPLRGWAAGFGAAFLLAFGEFEMASLLRVTAWSVTLFDAHAGGLPLGDSVRMALVPAPWEMVLLGAVLALLFGAGRHPAVSLEAPSRAGRWMRRPAAAYVIVAAALVAGVPLCKIAAGSAAGLATALSQSGGLWREVAASALFGAAAAACAWLLTGAVLGSRRRAPALAAAAPGLLGALVLALLVQAAFQLPGLRRFYDTPLPLVVCLALLLLPMAVLLRALVRATRPGAGLHAARLLHASGDAGVRRRGGLIEREILTRGRFWVIFLLFCWGYFDMVASSILPPAGVNPIFALLHNQMHYGQMSVLSAWVLLAFAVPIVVLAAAGAAPAVRRAAVRLKGTGVCT